MELEKETLRKLKEQLVRGDCKIIATELGVSQNYVSMVLAGKKKAEAVILSALNIAKDRKVLRDRIVADINRL